MDSYSIIQACTDEHIDALARFRFALMCDVFPDKDFSDIADNFIDATRRYFAERLVGPDEYACLAISGDKPIGCGCLTFQQKPPHIRNLRNLGAYVHSVYVKPADRGKGVATSIMGRLHDHARTRNVFRMSLTSSQFGRPLYRALGYQSSDKYMELEFGNSN